MLCVQEWVFGPGAHSWCGMLQSEFPSQLPARRQSVSTLHDTMGRPVYLMQCVEKVLFPSSTDTSINLLKSTIRIGCPVAVLTFIGPVSEESKKNAQGVGRFWIAH